MGKDFNARSTGSQPTPEEHVDVKSSYEELKSKQFPLKLKGICSSKGGDNRASDAKLTREQAIIYVETIEQ